MKAIPPDRGTKTLSQFLTCCLIAPMAPCIFAARLFFFLPISAKLTPGEERRSAKEVERPFAGQNAPSEVDRASQMQEAMRAHVYAEIRREFLQATVQSGQVTQERIWNVSDGHVHIYTIRGTLRRGGMATETPEPWTADFKAFASGVVGSCWGLENDPTSYRELPSVPTPDFWIY